MTAEATELVEVGRALYYGAVLVTLSGAIFLVALARLGERVLERVIGT